MAAELECAHLGVGPGRLQADSQPSHVYPTTSDRQRASGGTCLHELEMSQGRQSIPELVLLLVAGR